MISHFRHSVSPDVAQLLKQAALFRAKVVPVFVGGLKRGVSPADCAQAEKIIFLSGQLIAPVQRFRDRSWGGQVD